MTMRHQAVSLYSAPAVGRHHARWLMAVAVCLWLYAYGSMPVAVCLCLWLWLWLYAYGWRLWLMAELCR